jgi:predicted nucleic acid-binding Zn ribbon protein
MDAEKVSDCEQCGAPAKRIFSARVAVVYQGWGFNRTESLLPGDRPRRDFKQLKEKAEQIYYED